MGQAGREHADDLGRGLKVAADIAWLLAGGDCPRSRCITVERPASMRLVRRGTSPSIALAG